MILTGQAIRERIKDGRIVINPFNEKQLNPNSYNLTLHDTLLTYETNVLDPKLKHVMDEIKIPKCGMVLQPNELYLGRTVEFTETHDCVPLIEGRSSAARLGLSTHVSAGFGDIGFCGFWTLEITVVKPLIIYPNLQVCQIFYNTIEGPVYDTYITGKYQNNQETQGSKWYEEL